jgi:AhpD family alkylhydroperoxidase
MERLNAFKASPDAYKAMLSLEEYVRGSGIDHSLLELVKMRTSQINQCAFCIDMHAADARKAGESERRLYALSAWRDTTFFTPRERAALEWTETLTTLSQAHPSDAQFEQLKEHFSEREMVDLTLAIVAINGWNRLSVGFGKMPA